MVILLQLIIAQTVIISGLGCALGTHLLNGKKFHGHTFIKINENIDPPTAFVIGVVAVGAAIVTVRAIPNIYKYISETKPNKKWFSLGLVPIIVIPCIASQSILTGLTLSSLATLSVTIHKNLRHYMCLYAKCLIEEIQITQPEDLEKSNV